MALDNNEFTSLKKEYDREIRRTAPQDELPDWTKRAKELVKLSERLLVTLQTGSFERKREALTALGSNLILTRGILSIVHTKPVQALIKCFQKARAEIAKVEPGKALGFSTQNGGPMPAIPCLLAELEEVRTTILAEKLD